MQHVLTARNRKRAIYKIVCNITTISSSTVSYRYILDNFIVTASFKQLFNFYSSKSATLIGIRQTIAVSLHSQDLENLPYSIAVQSSR